MPKQSLAQRISYHLREIGRIGGNKTHGWNRLAFYKDEDRAHDYAARVLQEEGYSIRRDFFGNLIASKEGTDNTKRRIMQGTHLDTVLNGGNYDGVVGFIAAVESVKLAEKKARGRIARGIDIVIFRAEESTRFQRGCLGSSAAFGFLKQDDIRTLHAGSVSLDEAIRAHRGNPSSIGSASLNPDEYFAYFETHIEQAGVLEKNGIPVGIVTSIRAPERWIVPFIGRNSAQSAAKFVLAVERIAERYAKERDFVATVGKLSADYGYQQLIAGASSINTIPGTVNFKLGMWVNRVRTKYKNIAQRRGVKVNIYNTNRYNAPVIVEVTGVADHSGGTPMGRKYRKDALAAASEMILATPEYLIEKGVNAITYLDARSNNLRYRTSAVQEILKEAKNFGAIYFEQTQNSTPVESLDADLQSALRESASKLSIATMGLPSGPTHDAANAAHRGIPTEMLFVTSIGGISHNPKEYTPPNHIACAIKILADTIHRL